MAADSSQPIVVGVDGSELARVALGCAARRASRGGRLVVAHVPAVPGALLVSPYYRSAQAMARERGEEVLDEAKGAVPPDTALSTQLVEGPPAQGLVDLARTLDAREIVVGARGFGPFRRAAVGSTAHALLHEADRPVVVVPRRAVEREQRLASGAVPERPPVLVVGYDGSDHAREALDYAIVGAGGRGRVIAVYAYEAPAEFLGRPYFQRSLDQHQRHGRAVLAELEGRAGVETDLVEGNPTEALVRVAQARDADEIVVGARGVGRFRAALGSVSHGLLHEADRPLTIVP